MIYRSLILVFLIVYADTINAQDCFNTIRFKFSKSYSVEVADSVKTGDELSFRVSPGTHIFYIREKINDWGIISKDTITFPGCDSSFVFLYDPGEKRYLRTEPSDVRVYDNSAYLGSTPLVLTRSQSGLLLAKPGYNRRVLSDSLQAGLGVIKLLPENLYGKEISFLKSNLPHILMGSLLVLGGLSAYTKLKADRYYEQYSAFGHDNDLKTMRKYDLLSGISFGLLQINLAYLVYNFLIAGN
ncbi:MAG: hypothetical protein HUU54_06205 [Ignavibacteriaceae bacterium]|nr:hypothetical protein [Ignavibacteriaceae bacterium]